MKEVNELMAAYIPHVSFREYTLELSALYKILMTLQLVSYRHEATKLPLSFFLSSLP